MIIVKVISHLLAALMWAIVIKIYMLYNITTFWSAWLFVAVFLILLKAIGFSVRCLVFDKEDTEELKRLNNKAIDKFIERLDKLFKK